jgi:hypothetical protein
MRFGGVDNGGVRAGEAEVDLGGEVDGAAVAVVLRIEGIELGCQGGAAGERAREGVDGRELLFQHGLVVLTGF